MINKQLQVDIKEFIEEEGIIKAVLSSGMPDRQGEMIDQASWNLDEYKKNPVVLWSHDPFQPAIAQMQDIGINSDGMLEGVIKFAVKEYDFAKTIFNLYTGKFIRAFSVGFVNGKVDIVNDIKILRDNVLYEVSAVNIPADALALAKSKGIDISLIEEKAKPKKKSPECRMADETADECSSRKIPEIMKDDPEMDKEQAVAIALSMCKKECEEKAIGKLKVFLQKEGRVLSSKNRSIIERALSALEEVLHADTKKEGFSHVDRKSKYKKILNKAIRELLEVKRKSL